MKLSDNHKENLKLTLFYVVGIAFCIAFCYGAWQLGRYLNYNWSYKDMVQETICETVKQERHEEFFNPNVCEK